MKIGLQIPNFTFSAVRKAGQRPGTDRRRCRRGRVCQHLGDGSLLPDRRARPRVLGPAEDEMLEGYSTLSYLAGFTHRVRLGTMVTGVVYRYPGIMVKTITTLDVLSGGRAYLGIGAAWNERESRGLGVPFPPLKEPLRTPRRDAANCQPDVV